MDTALQRAISDLATRCSSPGAVLLPVGGGSQFEVFRTSIEPSVCVKIGLNDPAPLRREAAVLSQIRSPLFPQLIHDGSQHGYLLEELIRGQRLSGLPRSFLLDNLPRIAGDLSRLLEVLRTLPQPIVHRDIKPNHLFWRNRGLVIVDFGSAEIEGKRRGRQVDFKHPKLGTGKYPYQPLEQLAGDPHQDRRVDVFAAAAMIFEILTGELPYRNTEPGYRQALRVWESRENEMNGVLAFLPPRIRKELMGALRVDFRHRSPTLDSVASALEAEFSPARNRRSRRRPPRTSPGAGAEKRGPKAHRRRHEWRRDVRI